MHNSIDFEQSGSINISMQSNQSNITRDNRKSQLMQLKPLDPFEKPQVPKFRNDYSSSELTLKNQRFMGEKVFQGPKISVVDNTIAGESSIVKDY